MKLNGKQIKILSKITNSFYEDLKIEFLFHSNHLEGSTFTRENLELLLNKRLVTGNHSLDDIIETSHSIELFDKVVQESEDDLNKFMLFDWHRTLKRGSVDDEINNIGKWKLYENRIRGRDLRLALPHEVDTLMFNLIEDWKESDKNLEDIVKFHYRFERIHPFQDGNGRIGRFIILKQCLESNIDLIAIDQAYNDNYKDSLYKAQKTDDISDLKNVFELCQIRLNEKLNHYNDLIHTINQEIRSPINAEKEIDDWDMEK